MSVKLEDVAKLAGVSKTTVSRVLNNRGYISDKTKKKVNDAMKQLHYAPNAVARQLFKKETKIIGLIFPTVDNPFFSELIANLENDLFEAGYKVFIGNSMNNPEKEAKYLDDLIANQVDGLIVGAHNYNISEYKIANLPIVAIDRVMNKDIPLISSDNYNGGRIATESLLKSGAKKIVLTDGPLNVKSPAHDRRKAYEEVMKEHNLTSNTYVIDFNWPLNQKIEAVRDMFKKFPDMDGVFATNDIDASLILQEAKKIGYRVPQDLRIIGYDHANTTKILSPDLSSIEQPIKQMAEAAVETLLKRIKGVDVPEKQIFPIKLWEGKTL